MLCSDLLLSPLLLLLLLLLLHFMLLTQPCCKITQRNGASTYLVIHKSCGWCISIVSKDKPRLTDLYYVISGSKAQKYFLGRRIFSSYFTEYQWSSWLMLNYSAISIFWWNCPLSIPFLQNLLLEDKSEWLFLFATTAVPVLVWQCIGLVQDNFFRLPLQLKMQCTKTFLVITLLTVMRGRGRDDEGGK